MNNFTINANEFLNQSVQGYYKRDYTGYGNTGNPDFINHLKNTFNNTHSEILKNSMSELINILKVDLIDIRNTHSSKELTVCVVPRAKSESFYSANQRLFRAVVNLLVDRIPNMNNGTLYISRIEDTRTTHLNNSGYGGEGPMPYIGITSDTCSISNNVQGKDILLIDDIYTYGVNIDEDVIQALFDKGARSVIFYAVAKTYYGSIKPITPGWFGDSGDDLTEDDDLPF